MGAMVWLMGRKRKGGNRTDYQRTGNPAPLRRIGIPKEKKEGLPPSGGGGNGGVIYPGRKGGSRLPNANSLSGGGEILHVPKGLVEKKGDRRGGS